MRQRLGLAAALLGAPRLLVLDEPTNGLDPQGIREMRDLLLELNAQGTTIFLSSHLLAEVEQMCTRVGVLDRGRLVVQDELRVLQAPTGRTFVVTPDVDRVVGLLNGRVEARDGQRLVVRAPDAAALNRSLVDAGVRVEELGPERRGLEQVVLEATTDPGQVGVSR
jgi:ABC-2 type transport system ATP-binding protein